MNNLGLNLLTFPFWWYTTGTRLLWGRARQSIHFGLQKTGLLLFTKHMKEPLYGDYTKSGLFIGFILRCVLLVIKLFMFTLRLLFIMLGLVLYWLMLPAVISLIIYQLF